MNKNELNFFEPLWRRIAVVAFCSAWTVWELSNGEQLWALMTGGIAVYCVWNLFFVFEKNKKDLDSKKNLDSKSDK